MTPVVIQILCSIKKLVDENEKVILHSCDLKVNFLRQIIFFIISNNISYDRFFITILQTDHQYDYLTMKISETMKNSHLLTISISSEIDYIRLFMEMKGMIFSYQSAYMWDFLFVNIKRDGTFKFKLGQSMPS